MRVQDFHTAPRRGAASHRAGGLSFVSLLTGAEGAPDNFELMIVRVEVDYATPLHRHNFDQIRIILDGHFEWAPGVPQPEGSVGYFAEGTSYTQKGVGVSETLLLQVGGASGHGYTSHRQLQTAIEELQMLGTFSEGVYRRARADGETDRIDGYQAIWEHINARKLVYPAARFQAPVIAFPDAFGWQALGEGDRAGALQRRFGVFNERGTSAGQVAVAAGACAHLDAGPQTLLIYVEAGAGTIDGMAFGERAAIRIDRGERAEIIASRDIRMFTFALPRF